MKLSKSDIAAGRALISRHITVDCHAHPGRSFVKGAKDLSLKFKLFAARGAFEKRALKEMRAGGLTAASFATVSDFQVLDIGRTGLTTDREFQPGEAWASHCVQVGNLNQLADRRQVIRIENSKDFSRAKQAGIPGAVFTAEGADFLEGSLERLEEVKDQGVRMITLVHYRANETGDIQTEPPLHGGLTAFGADLVRAMNDFGMVIDLSHATKPMVRRVVEVSRHPVIVSHSNIRDEDYDHARFIDLDMARAVAKSGGMIGAWPAGFGGLDSFEKYVEQIIRMVGLIGVDHVGIGSDMDANFRPVFKDYRDLPKLAVALMREGLAEEEVAKILGDNFVRLFAEVVV